MMRSMRDIKAVSRLILILTLLITFIIGALFSYIYTMGFYAPSEFRLPEKSVIVIQSVEFSNQDTSFFNVTVLNPSYSPSSVDITRIEVRTPDDNRIHVIADTQPIIPHTLKRGELQTFRALWNWANYTDIQLPYTDKPVEIRVFLQDGRGGIFEAVRPSTPVTITNLSFDPSISVHHFNVSVQNPASSQTYVNITAINIEGVALQTEAVNPTLPYSLNPGDMPVRFQCFYNWTGFLGQSATVGISTLQGYIAENSEILPGPVTWGIQQILFNPANSTHFNMTVINAANSSTYVDVSRIAVSVDQGAPINISAWSASPSSRLETNSSILIVCTWDWTSLKGQGSTAKVSTYTLQGFTATKEELIP